MATLNPSYCNGLDFVTFTPFTPFTRSPLDPTSSKELTYMCPECIAKTLCLQLGLVEQNLDIHYGDCDVMHCKNPAEYRVQLPNLTEIEILKLLDEHKDDLPVLKRSELESINV